MPMISETHGGTSCIGNSQHSQNKRNGITAKLTGLQNKSSGRNSYRSKIVLHEGKGGSRWLSGLLTGINDYYDVVLLLGGVVTASSHSPSLKLSGENLVRATGRVTAQPNVTSSLEMSL